MNRPFIRRGMMAARLWLLSLLALNIPSVATAQTAVGTPSFRDYVMTINRSTMAVVDSTVVVSLQMTAIQDVPAMQSVVLAPVLEDTVSLRKVEFPLIFLNSRNQQIYFDRGMKDEYPDAMVLRKKNGVDLDIDYLRTVKYEPWMDRGVLKLRKQSCACNDTKDRGELVVATFPHEEAAPVINLFPVYLLPPADNTLKVREERGSAYLCFEVNKWDIKPDYMTNPEELQKIHNSVNLVRSDSDVTITKMTIEGFASPEAPYDHNLMLSEKRTEALKNYLLRTNIAKGIRIEASGKGENWDGFKKYLRENTGIPQRDRLISIANSSIGPDEKEKRMRQEAAEGFRYAVENGFPALRCTNYVVIYTVRPFTLEESERVFETKPVNLNINEIYRLADKYAGNEEKYYSIIRKAYMIYPDDSYINLTMAYLAIKKGESQEAMEYLNKVKDSPEKTMNLGLVAYLNGDMQQAIQLVEQARQQGVKEAAQQLEEFGKLKNNKNIKN